MTEWLIETQDLVKVYGDGAEIRALNGVSICIESGEFITVMGPSGSGKSTLLNMIGALDRPTSGCVLVNGQDLAEVRNLDMFRAQTVGFVFQLHNLLPTMTARENVEVPMVGRELSARARHDRAAELLEKVDMSDRMDHLPNQLSGGQRQRVAVARALANNPPLILGDEPTGSLDTNAGYELMTLMRELNRSQGTTFIIVTHDPAVARQTDRILVMQDGKIAREDIIGTPAEEDIKVLAHSELGQKILAGEAPDPTLGISTEETHALQQLLTRLGDR